MTSNISTQPLSTIKTAGLEARTATMPLGETEYRTDLPELKVSKPLQIPMRAKQHVVVVRDCSSSMGGHKISEVNTATLELIEELANEQNKDGFLVSLVDFANTANCRAYAKSAIGINAPQAVASGGTNFDNAMSRTIETIRKLQTSPNPDGWKYLRPVILFLSDGQSRVAEKNIQDLQEIADVTTIAYGSDADISTLSRIASNGQCEVIGASGSELREFLADVGQTLSQGLATAR